MKARPRVHLHWIGDRIAVANRVEDLLPHCFEDRVIRRFLSNMDRFQNWNARLNQRAKSTRRTRNDGFFKEDSEDRHAQ